MCRFFSPWSLFVKLAGGRFVFYDGGHRVMGEGLRITSKEADMSTYTTPATSTRGTTNGWAVAGLVCGIVGVFLFNIILGPLAIVFGGIAWSRANQSQAPHGMAIASVILGVVDIALFGLLLAVVSHHGGYWHVG